MKNTRYAIDNASILFLSQIRKDHTNTFRFSMTLTEDISPDILQQAVDRVYRRFPTVIAAFRPGLFHFYQIPAAQPPQVMPDPGCLLTMSRESLSICAYRVYYRGKTISIEAFHALTDGYGAIASFTTLVAEYLRLKHGITIPVVNTLVDLEMSPQMYEVEDAFLACQNGAPKRIPRRLSYQLSDGNAARTSVKTASYQLPAKKLLDAAHRYGVTINTLLSGVMAASVMEVQKAAAPSRILPVRIMVPVNLRRLFPSRTLRNFSYYTLPTMEPEESRKPLGELLHSFSAQINAQLQKEHMASIVSNNVKLQNAWYFRVLPLPIKSSLMRLICRFFGEVTSSITVTNLGNVELPEQMREYVTHMDVILTPRIRSPFGCTILSYNGDLTINISRFSSRTELEQLFFGKLEQILNSEDIL